MFSPYFIFGIFAGIIYLSWRSAMKKRRAAGDGVPVPHVQ